MSSMPASHGHNEACCNIPPVVASGYNKKGDYEEVGGFKSCRFISKLYGLFLFPLSNINQTSPALKMPRRASW
jgi:hypothetical protein